MPTHISICIKKSHPCSSPFHQNNNKKKGKETTTDTLLVFEACRRGILPKINRRLQEKERNAIRSGTVFVFDERESGIKRWTDGLIWSPSRILGNFLIYRELDGRANNSNQLKRASTSSCDNSFSLYQQQSYQENDLRYDPSSVFSTPTTPPPPQQVSPRSSFDQESHYRERALLGSLTTSYKFKPNGLIKKTMSIVLNGSHLHMISYYNKDDVLNNKLSTPSTTPQLANLNISPDMIQRQSFRVSPLLESRLSHLYMNDASPASPSSSSPSPFMNPINSNSTTATTTTTTTNMNSRDPYYFQQQQQQQHHYHHQQQQMKSLPSPNAYSTSITTVTATKIGQKRKERSISPSSLDLMDNDHNRKYSKTHLDDNNSLRSSFSSHHERPHANHNSNSNNMISSEYMVYGNNSNNNNSNTSSSPPPHSTTVPPITSNYALSSTHHHQQQDQNKIKVSYLNMNHSSNDQYQHPLDNSLPSPRSQQQHPLYTRDTTSYPQSPSTPTTIHSSNYSAYSPPSQQQQQPPPPPSNSSSPGDHYNRHVYHPSVRHSIVHPSSSFLPSPF
ncbi:Gti1/Pac2 family-domain-containing protein [Cunninghamella echinulata]|nr:Gti1/Pac2 family-domain-containing protein [Cunninghamella echinulata]